MQTFDGENEHSVLILDNCSVHHVRDIKDLLDKAGIVTLYLPPYSPDINPIEELFSFVKCYLRKHDQHISILPNLTDILNSAFQEVTDKHCNAWITHSGYIL